MADNDYMPVERQTRSLKDLESKLFDGAPEISEDRRETFYGGCNTLSVERIENTSRALPGEATASGASLPTRLKDASVGRQVDRVKISLEFLGRIPLL